MLDNPGGYVYGTILVATLLAGENGHQSFGTTAGSVAGALAVYWLAISYAEYAGHRAEAEAGHHFSLRGFADVARHELAVLVGALGPLVAVVACWAAGTSVQTATWVAVLAAAAIIAATELVLGLRSHLDGSDLVVQTGFGVLFGLAIVALRVLLH